MSRLNIRDLNFCETVSGSQIQGGLNSSWSWLPSYISNNFQEKTFSDQKDDLAIEGYSDEDNYAVIGSNPDKKKQFVTMVGRNEDGGNFSIAYTKVQKNSVI